MTSLERARRFVEAKGRVVALSVVPLAALSSLVAPAKAGTLTFSGGGCSASSSPTSSGATSVSGSCIAATFGSGIAPNTSDGIKLQTTSSGGVTETANAQVMATLSILGSGSANQDAYQGMLPVDWDFTVAASNTSMVNYSLTFTLAAGGIVSFEGNQETTGVTVAAATITETGMLASGSGTISGFDDLSLSGVSSISGWSLSLSLSQAQNSGDTLNVSIPASSIDINTESGSTPEPASVLLGGSGMLGLLLARFRRKKNR